MSNLLKKYRDERPIVDKYTTGCNMELITSEVLGASTVNGVFYKVTGSLGVIALDFQYNNTQLPTELIIENTSFPTGLQQLNSSVLDRKVIFKNCFFKSFVSPSNDPKVVYEFYDCTSLYNSGSYQKHVRTLTGKHMGDGFNPFRNFTVIDSYACDLNQFAAAGITHADGVQLFGYTGLVTENIIFDNFRVEGVQFPIEGQSSGCYVNSCLSVAIEKETGNNIHFSNCVINGGGFAIYCTGNNKTNVSFTDIRAGYSNRYGLFYSNNNYENVVIDNVRHVSQLYIASVRKINNHVIISVTNDSLHARKLIIRTNLGVQVIVIPKSYKQDYNIVGYMSYEDYPIDIPIDLGVIDWFVAYDETVRTDNQIRFVNYTENEIEEILWDNPISQDLMVLKKKSIFQLPPPPEYTRVNYLRSTGTQFIETGLKGRGAHTRVIDIVAKTLNGVNYLFGAATGSAVNRFNALSTLSTSTGGNCRSDYDNIIGTLKTDPAFYLNKKFTIDKDMNITKYYDESGNLVFTEEQPIDDFETQGDMIMFGVRIGTAVSLGQHIRYEQYIFVDGVMVRHYLPIVDKTGRPGMLDLVNNTYNYNAGTGEFLYN